MDLAKRIKENDNRCTAMPYLILLQVKRTYVGDEDYSHDGQVQYVEHYSGNYARADTEEELKKEIKSWHDEDEEIDFEKYDITRHWQGFYWDTVNVFLTDKGYKEHLQQNRHNLGEHRTFMIHAFRNQEMQEVFKIIGAME